MVKKISRNRKIAWSLQGLLILIACVAVWFYVTRGYNIHDERRYHALSNALSQVGVAYWERDIETGEYRFGENFADFLGIEALSLSTPTWWGSVVEFLRRIHPESVTVEDWLIAVHPEDQTPLREMLETEQGNFSGTFRIRSNSHGWRQVLVYGSVEGPLLVGVCAAFPEAPLEQPKSKS